jgi:hypothetical protein
MENIICNLCAGSPEIELFPISLNDDEQIFLNKSYGVLKTDICIGREIKHLIKSGIRTYGCCCGHGEKKPSCLVNISSKNKLESMGYVLHEYNHEWTKSGIMEVDLKTDIQNELREVLKNKVFRYIEGE